MMMEVVSEGGVSGFSTRCAAASAADSVIGNHEVGRREAEETQHHDFSFPPRVTARSRIRMLPRPWGTHVGHAAVRPSGARRNKGDDDEDERRHRRKNAGGQKGDAGLIGERREVVDAG